MKKKPLVHGEYSETSYRGVGLAEMKRYCEITTKAMTADRRGKYGGVERVENDYEGDY